MILLYYFSQKSDFFESIKPLLGNVKSSEDMLKFLNELNRFSEIMNAFKNAGSAGNAQEKTAEAAASAQNDSKTQPPPTKEKPQSPTAGIADDFIQKSLDAYFKKRS